MERGHKLPRIRYILDCPAILERRKREKRGFGQTGCHGHKTICLSSNLVLLPAKQQLGIVAHEIGHVVSQSGSQRVADRCAEALFGHPIRYVGRMRLESF